MGEQRQRRHLEVGQVFVHERCFTHEDVIAFQHVSGDAGRHHAEPDATGRRVVQGLLTASIATKIGGDLDYWGREMSFEFLRPVFTGDTIRCTLTVVEVVPEPARVGGNPQTPGRVRLKLTGACHDERGREVLRISTRGMVLDDAG